VRLWDAVSGAEIAVLGGQGGVVGAVALGGPAIARWWSRAAMTGFGCGMR